MLTVNELFAGIGSQRAALERLGIEHKVVGIAEIDKFAIKSYETIWGPTKNYGDISKADKLDYADFWTYSFPCQDISVAGKQAGINENTRSGLLYEVERLLEVAQEHDELPKYLMLENVKNLVGKKFKPQFEEWITRLDELGYNTYWQVLNAKNYGIPQNRERVFGISIRKDIDTGYVFPEPFELKIRLKDILEGEVDEKFYINNDRMNVLLKNLETSKLQKDSTDVNQIGNCVESKGSFKNPQRGRVYSENGCSPALNCVGGGGLEPKIIEPKLEFIGGLKEGKKWLDDGKDNSRNFSQGSRVYDSRGLATTLTAQGVGGKGGYSGLYKVPEPKIAASRGRNPENSSDRTKGAPTEQRLEINQNGTSNTITTVQKDNYVLIPQATKKGYIECNVPGVADLSFPDSKTRRGRVQEDGEICPTLMAGQQDVCYIEPNVLTPKRTEYGKAIRKDYESGKIQESRHNMTELQPREDGISNTLTTVQKDIML